MPVRSGSSTSWRKACARRCSSNRRLIMVQSSNWKSLKRGVDAPMFMMSSTPKTSRFSKSTVSSSSSSSFFSSFSSSFFSAFSSLSSSIGAASPSFFSSDSFAAASFLAASLAAAAAFFAALAASFFANVALYSPCFACHCCRTFCHSTHFCWNQSDGVRSSTRVVSFLSATQVFKYSCAFECDLLHSCLISSKPSSFSGRVNSARDVLRV
mmetsp:Transcript_43759/g.135821  ORF Transcript_43759/g.135821 Transcript_43759/m.135821 type:complete len:211 (+) Transcript_43759:602-1234(+)